MNMQALSTYRHGGTAFGAEKEPSFFEQVAAELEKGRKIATEIGKGVDTVSQVYTAAKQIFSPTEKAQKNFITGTPAPGSQIVYELPRKGIPTTVYVAGAVILGGIGLFALMRR